MPAILKEKSFSRIYYNELHLKKVKTFHLIPYSALLHIFIFDMGKCVYK